MSKSWRTHPTWIQGASRIARDREGQALLPRITEHPPGRGDVYVVNRKLLLRLLPLVPVRYRYGLKAIELRPRKNAVVGQPYAVYCPLPRVIELYSAPLHAWPLNTVIRRTAHICEELGARFVVEQGQEFLYWDNAIDSARFLFGFVFAHELGHHYMFQYRHKRKLPETTRGHERGADKHAFSGIGFRAFNRFIRENGPELYRDLVDLPEETPDKSLAAEDAGEEQSVTAKNARDAKKSVQGRKDNAKAGAGRRA